MALVVETGEGLPDAESLTSVAFVDQYASDRGFSDWLAKTLQEKEQALRLATDYLQKTYYGRWSGYRSKDDQALDFPRAYMPKERSLVDRNSILSPTGDSAFYRADQVPKESQQATAEMAIRSLTTTLIEDVARLTKREKVGSLEVEYADFASPVTTYPSIDRLVSRFFGDGLEQGGSKFSAGLVRT